MELSDVSKTKLAGVHPDLRKVVYRAAETTTLDFTVIEGRRTLERQRELLAKGATTTLQSRHLTGHAVDLAPVVTGEVRWDWPLFYQLAPIVKRAAIDVGVSLEWGGDWRKFKDGPHFQLPEAEYPAEGA